MGGRMATHPLFHSRIVRLSSRCWWAPCLATSNRQRASWSQSTLKSSMNNPITAAP